MFDASWYSLHFLLRHTNWIRGWGYEKAPRELFRRYYLTVLGGFAGSVVANTVLC